MNNNRKIFLCSAYIFLFVFVIAGKPFAQKTNLSLSFTVSVKNAASHLYHVIFYCKGIKQKSVEFKIPVWTPGYYQILDFPGNIENFSASDNSGKSLKWEKSS
ncbi:MAG: hypothetical protein ABUT20_26680, partial [Bacteroidota bacterium]